MYSASPGTSTGRGRVSTACTSARLKGEPDRAQPGRPRQARLQDPRELNIVPRIAPPRIEPANHLGRHRYVIERCLDWTTRFRRLVRRYERKASHFLGFLRLACAVICFRRAARLNLLTSNNPN